MEELREVRRRGLVEAVSARDSVRVTMPAGDECWRVIPIDEDFMLVSRRGTLLTPVQREAVLLALKTGAAPRKTHNAKN
jgi:hypothetical protein